MNVTTFFLLSCYYNQGQSFFDYHVERYELNISPSHGYNYGNSQQYFHSYGMNDEYGRIGLLAIDLVILFLFGVIGCLCIIVCGFIIHIVSKSNKYRVSADYKRVPLDEQCDISDLQVNTLFTLFILVVLCFFVYSLINKIETICTLYSGSLIILV